MFFFVFFFKQKTAYEMRISDWSSTCALPICTVEVDRRRIGLAALPQIALDRAEVQKGRKPRWLQRHIIRIFARRRENILDGALFGRHFDHDHRQRAGIVCQLNPGLAKIIGTAIGKWHEAERKSGVSGKRWEVRVDT